MKTPLYFSALWKMDQALCRHYYYFNLLWQVNQCFLILLLPESTTFFNGKTGEIKGLQEETVTKGITRARLKKQK